MQPREHSTGLLGSISRSPPPSAVTGGLGVAFLSDAGVGEFSQKEPRENEGLSSDGRYVHFIGKKFFTSKYFGKL